MATGCVRALVDGLARGGSGLANGGLGGVDGRLHLVDGHGGYLTCGFGCTAFGIQLGDLICDQHGAKLHLVGFHALGTHLGNGRAHAALEAADHIGGDGALAQQRVRRDAAVGVEGFHGARQAIERDVANIAERLARFGHNGKPDPQNTIVPVQTHLLASSLATGCGVGAQHHTPVDHVVAVDGHELVGTMEHPQQIGTLHHKADHALFLRVEHEASDFADSLGSLLPADHTHTGELFGCHELASHFHPPYKQKRRAEPDVVLGAAASRHAIRQSLFGLFDLLGSFLNGLGDFLLGVLDLLGNGLDGLGGSLGGFAGVLGYLVGDALTCGFDLVAQLVAFLGSGLQVAGNLLHASGSLAGNLLRLGGDLLIRLLSSLTRVGAQVLGVAPKSVDLLGDDGAVLLTIVRGKQQSRCSSDDTTKQGESKFVAHSGLLKAS